MKDATHLTLVCDRTGSMATIKDDAEGGVNHFLDEQKKVEGECSLYFVEFDSDGYDVIYDGPLAGAPRYRLVPRNFTPLLDAVGKAIVQTGDKLSAIPETERPDKVIFIVQTDGLENASKEWTWETVRDAIKRQETEFNWQFVFLGVGPDTWNQAQQMGIRNSTRSMATGQSVASTYDNTSFAATQYRRGATSDMHLAAATVDEHGNVTHDDEDEQQN